MSMSTENMDTNNEDVTTEMIGTMDTTQSQLQTSEITPPLPSGKNGGVVSVSDDPDAISIKIGFMSPSSMGSTSGVSTRFEYIAGGVVMAVQDFQASGRLSNVTFR